MKFRSVLPHEPLPNEQLGYIHLQGAFTPKYRNPPQNDTEGSSATALSFWTKEKLEAALISSLNCEITTSYENSRSQGEEERPYTATRSAYAVKEVQLLDAAPPFTKVRLVYESPPAAYQVLSAYRKAKPTPAQLLSQYEKTDDSIIFGSRPLIMTQITMQPMPSPKLAWTRASPPKFRRLIPREGEDPAIIEEERKKTRFLYVSNLLDDGDKNDSTPFQFWEDAQGIMESIRSVLNSYDTSNLGVEVYVSNKKRKQHCHIGMRSATDAQTVIHALQEQVVEWKWRKCSGPREEQCHQITSGKLFLDYASITKRSEALAQARTLGIQQEDPKGEPSRSECTSTTAATVVPGLVLVPDFVSQAEEEVLMAVLRGPQAPWAPSQSTPTEGGVVKRRVQHYGYVFDYKTADVLRDRTANGANCPKMPALPDSFRQRLQQENIHQMLEDYTKECVNKGQGWEALAGLVERTRQFNYSSSTHDSNGEKRSYPFLNQLTVNQYAPGEGIGSHVDTPSAFGDGLISISLNSGVVMEFREVAEKCGDVDSTQNSKRKRKLVYLPPRSLLLMSGPARYNWEHMIVGRMTDTVNGVVLKRSLRISLTFRTALDLEGANMPPAENFYNSSSSQPIWGGNEEDDDAEHSALAFKTPDCERDYVHAVYDAVAVQWHHTRGRRGVLWPSTVHFLQKISKGSVVADIGCGDGKYFPAIWESGSYVIGTDISLPLLQTSTNATIHDDGVTGRNFDLAESRQVSEHRQFLRNRPGVAVADCMSIPLRSNSVDAAICIAVLHHLSTRARRLRCIEELTRVVRPGGLINIQAWAMDQEKNSRRKFAVNDVFVPFHAQPKYLDLHSQATANVSTGGDDASGAHSNKSMAPEQVKANQSASNKSTAQVYSQAFQNSEYDDKKGLVIFKRFCHLYHKGELEELVSAVPNVALVESGFESGNYFVILEVLPS